MTEPQTPIEKQPRGCGRWLGIAALSVLGLMILSIIGTSLAGERVSDEFTLASDTSTTSTTSTTTTTASSSGGADWSGQQPTDRELYLLYVRGAIADLPLNILSSASDAQLIEIARGGCAVFDSGGDISDVFEVAVSVAQTQADLDASAIAIGAGVQQFCPEHRDELG